MKTIVSFLVLVFVVYLAITLFVYANQRKMMYFPATDRLTPEDAGLSNVDVVTLVDAANLSTQSWFAPANTGRPTMLFFHGNGGSLGSRAHRFRDFMAAGYGIFMLGYPGYGGNAGRPSERAFIEASQLSYRYLRDQGVQPDDIVIYGESIGSGVAVQLAATVDARAIVLEAPMSSTTDVASGHYPFLPVRYLLKDTFDSAAYIGRVDMPVLIMHGDQDRIIPLRSGQVLFAAAKEPKTFVAFNGAGHNDLQQFPVIEAVNKFLGDL